MGNKSVAAAGTAIVSALLTLPVLFAQALPVMLAFGIAHSHLQGVPAFGYFESIGLVWGLRVLALVAGVKAGAQA